MTALSDLTDLSGTSARAAPRSRHRAIGVAAGLGGVSLTAVALAVNVLVAGGEASGDHLLGTFGLATAGFGTLKLAIAVTLLGILVHLTMRVAAVREVLPVLKAAAEPEELRPGDVETPFGRAQVSRRAPGLLPPQAMARLMWKPMLAMGAIFVAVGLALSIVNAAASDAGSRQALSAWTQGTQFLGEAMLLAGITFLLGSILAGLREGGGSVQESLGLLVKTLRFPTSAKLFLALMLGGLLLGVAQFVLYGIAAYADDPATWFAWLGPLRELSVGILLSGIVLALFTIGTVLGFQHWRIKQIIETGR